MSDIENAPDILDGDDFLHYALRNRAERAEAEVEQLREDADRLRRHVREAVGRALRLTNQRDEVLALCDQTDADPTMWVGAYFAVPTSEIRRTLGVES